MRHPSVSRSVQPAMSSHSRMPEQSTIRTRLASRLSAGALAAVFLAGFLSAHLMLNPLERAAEYLHNPFGFARTVAPSGAVVLEQIQRLNRLETCRYNGHVIVRGDDTGILPVWLAGDRMLFVGQGEVVAGVDLATLRQSDVRVQDGTAWVHLPATEILSTRLDNGQSEVYERETGLFSKPDMTLETRVRLEAEDRIRQAALDGGVLKTAAANAEDAVRRQLSLVGVHEVHFD